MKCRGREVYIFKGLGFRLDIDRGKGSLSEKIYGDVVELGNVSPLACQKCLSKIGNPL